ncbi:MAG: hypothetical protein LBU89_07360 [Fibromonadaceae bacterium]|nr:hypothetical protein [Fibromonadaceae bacterium]
MASGKWLVASGVATLLLISCAKKPQVYTFPDGAKVVLPDSARVKAMVSVSQNDVKEKLSAVLFAVPNQRYRLELSGTFGIGAASLLWKSDGWKLVFPQEERYMEGTGDCVFLPTYGGVDIHKFSLLFLGNRVNDLACENSISPDLTLEYRENSILIHPMLLIEIRNIDKKSKWGSGVWNLNVPDKYVRVIPQ